METYEPMPTYKEVVLGIFAAYREFSDSEKYPTDTAFILRSAWGLTFSDLLIIIGLITVISTARHYLTHQLLVPFAHSISLSKTRKFCESAFKFTAYLLLWSYSLWVIIFSGKYDYFQRPTRTMNYTLLSSEVIPNDIRWMYLAQIAFYLHGFYATLYLDVRRKDSRVMLLHHFVTLFLLYFSFTMKYYKMGALVLCLHDVSDIFLEGTKLCVYLKAVPGRFQKTFDVLSSIGFAIFAGSWALCRLYWFPLKLVHAANHGNLVNNVNEHYPKLWFVLNFMFLTLQALHVYWFCLIMQLLYKILTGQNLHDSREYDSDSDKNSTTAASLADEVRPAAAVTAFNSAPPVPPEVRRRHPGPNSRQNGLL